MTDLDLEAIRELLDRRADPGRTHFGACEVVHIDCAAAVLLVEVERLRAAILEHSCGIRRGCLCPGGDHHDPDNSACPAGKPFEAERRLKETAR